MALAEETTMVDTAVADIRLMTWMWRRARAVASAVMWRSARR